MNPNVSNSNVGNVNSKQNSYLTRTPLQAKINPNGSKTNYDNSSIKISSELKLCHTENKIDKVDNITLNEIKEHITPCKTCEENNYSTERDIKLNLKEVSELEKLPEEKENISDSSSSYGSIRPYDEMFTFVNMLDIQKMDKLNAWIDEGLYFDE